MHNSEKKRTVFSFSVISENNYLRLSVKRLSLDKTFASDNWNTIIFNFCVYVDHFNRTFGIVTKRK